MFLFALRKASNKKADGENVETVSAHTVDMLDLCTERWYHVDAVLNKENKNIFILFLFSW